MEEDGISNVYIDKPMNKISRSFHGTFSIDNIPEIDNDVFSIIINLSKHHEKGTHFIAIYSLKDKILYFDSFGMPIELSLRNYLKNYKKQMISSMFWLQNIFSNHCGFFCISFIVCIENNLTFNNFLSIFSRKELFLNDYICIETIKIVIKHMYLRTQMNLIC